MNRPSADFAPFIVFGSSKSGTTWLQRLLDSHPQIRCHFQLPVFPLKEPFLWLTWKRYRVGRSGAFGGVFEDASAEHRYLRIHNLLYNMDILQPGFYKEMTNGSSGTSDPEVVDTYRRILQGMTEAVLKDAPGKKIFGSKAYTDLEMYFDVFPEARVVHIIRDGRDVCVSKRFHFLRMGIYFPGEERSPWLRALTRLPFGQYAAMQLQNRSKVLSESDFVTPGTDSPLFTSDSLKKISTEWERITRYILRFQKRFPDRFCTVRYEQLKQEPVAALTTVCTFLGAAVSEPVLTAMVEKNAFNRLKKGNEGFFRKGTTGDWKNHFTAKDVELFKSIAGDLLVELGYEASDKWPALNPS
jgi:hypothetical protein